MQYLQRRLHRSVTERRKLLSGRPKVSAAGSADKLEELVFMLGMFLDPNFPFRRVFQLPDWGNLLQLVDRPLAGPKRFGPMLSADDNEDNILTDSDLTVTMEDQHFDHIEILQRPLTNLPQLFLRHAFIVLERHAIHIPALRSIARRAEKNRNPADALRSTSYTVDLLVQGKILPLHPNEHVVTVSHGTCHQISPSLILTRIQDVQICRPTAPQQAKARDVRCSVRRTSKRCANAVGSLLQNPVRHPPANGGKSATSSRSSIVVSSWAISWFTDTRIVFFRINSPIAGYPVSITSTRSFTRRPLTRSKDNEL